MIQLKLLRPVEIANILKRVLLFSKDYVRSIFIYQCRNKSYEAITFMYLTLELKDPPPPPPPPPACPIAPNK